MKLVTVVVPIYNVEKYLERCINSILNQTYQNIEIILIDDGSTDRSGVICDAFRKKNNIVVIHKENEGLGVTRNRGIEIANGEFICFIDSDDYISSDYIEKLYNCIMDNEADGCYCGHTKVMDGVVEERKNPLYGNMYGKEEILNEIIPRMCGCRYGNDNIEMSSCMALYSLSIIKENNIRFPSEREFISEDLLFNIDYLAYCNSISISDLTGYYYVSVGSSLTRKYNPERFEKQIVMTKEIIRKTNELGIFSKCENRIYNNFMTWVRAIIKSEQNQWRKFGKKNTLKKIKEVCLNEYVLQVLYVYDDSDVKLSSRIVNLCIKERAYVILWIIMEIKNRLGV